MSKALSLIIPTYRERDNIVPLVQRIGQALVGCDYEVIFIDDNSRDGTAELVTGLSPQYPVRIIVRKDKRGLASAVIDGLSHVASQIVVVMDADLQHSPEVIPALVREMEDGADMAIASRYARGGSCPASWGLSRRIISKGAIALAHLLLPATRQFSDPVSGFFAFNPQIVAGAQLNPIGYKILLEIIMEGKFQKVAEVPYIFGTRSSGESKLSSRQQMDYLKQLFGLMKRKGELLRFGKFCAVGLSGVVVNEGLLWLLTEMIGIRCDISWYFSTEASIISNFILNDYFTFPDRRSAGAKSFGFRLFKFNAVSLPGLAISRGIFWLLTTGVQLHYLIANLVGIAVATLWNYLVNTWWTWK